jgi:hypothetical protein
MRPRLWISRRVVWSLIVAVALVASLTESAMSQVRVRGYFRKNGTYVRPHYRSNPDGNFYNNWSTKGNMNPYTGKPGTRVTPPAGQRRSTSGVFGSPQRITTTAAKGSRSLQGNERSTASSVVRRKSVAFPNDLVRASTRLRAQLRRMPGIGISWISYLQLNDIISHTEATDTAKVLKNIKQKLSKDNPGLTVDQREFLHESTFSEFRQAVDKVSGTVRTQRKQSRQASNITARQLERLSRGQTRDEAKAILGGPENISSHGNGTHTWEYVTANTKGLMGVWLYFSLDTGKLMFWAEIRS